MGVLTYLRTSSLTLPLSIVLNFSPLPPLTTILYLGKLGVYGELPRELVDPEDLRRRGCAPEFVRLYEEALLAQRTGRREGLRNVLERSMRELRTALDMMDYNVSTMVEVLSLVTIVVPLTLASVMVFVSPGSMLPAVTASSLVGLVLTALLGMYFVPWELWLRRPRALSLAPMLLGLPAYHLLGDAVLSLALAVALSAPLVYLEQRRAVGVLDEAVDLLSRASHSPNPVLAGVDLDDLLDRRFYGVSRAATVTLYTLFTQGGSKYYEGVARLLAYVRDVAEAFRGLRRKALQSFAYALVMAAMAAAAMAIIISVIEYMASLPAPVSVSGVSLSPGDVTLVRAAMPAYIALTSLSYAVAAACMRDGNPLYFPLYLAAILPASYAGYHLTLLYAPSMLGVGP
ncbi:MAG: hypothetical protein DRJ56_05420 [Thermoprotei archaeon]|nr:MAG: hypothetical protein DRJ56_05420 [Thermoprotei archaeon]